MCDFSPFISGRFYIIQTWHISGMGSICTVFTWRKEYPFSQADFLAWLNNSLPIPLLWYSFKTPITASSTVSLPVSLRHWKPSGLPPSHAQKKGCSALDLIYSSRNAEPIRQGFQYVSGDGLFFCAIVNLPYLHCAILSWIHIKWIGMYRLSDGIFCNSITIRLKAAPPPLSETAGNTRLPVHRKLFFCIPVIEPGQLRFKKGSCLFGRPVFI